MSRGAVGSGVVGVGGDAVVGMGVGGGGRRCLVGPSEVVGSGGPRSGGPAWLGLDVGACMVGVGCCAT